MSCNTANRFMYYTVHRRLALPGHRLRLLLRRRPLLLLRPAGGEGPTGRAQDVPREEDAGGKGLLFDYK